MNRPLLVCIGLLLSAVAPSAASAQNCGFWCGDGEEEGGCCGAGWHSITPGWYYTGRHSDCRVNPGGHGECWTMLDPKVGSAYGNLVLAANRGDVAGILKLSPGALDFVSINWQRHAVQLLSCDGKSIIASITMPRTAAITALAARVDQLKVATYGIAFSQIKQTQSMWFGKQPIAAFIPASTAPGQQ